MKRRGWKYFALAVAGSVLFQSAGCATLLVDTLVNNLVPLLLSQLVTSATT